MTETVASKGPAGSDKPLKSKKGVSTLPEPPAVQVSAIHAMSAAGSQGNRLGAFTDVAVEDPNEGGKAKWHHAKLVGLSDLDKAAVAWIVAQAVMESRTGGNNAYTSWFVATATESKLTGADLDLAHLFIEDVFGLPAGHKPPADHLIGHVGEWLWYLHLVEMTEEHRTILSLESPKFGVTEQGADGLAMYEATDGGAASFCLWEMKKLTGGASVSKATGRAYEQLKQKGGKYLAKLTKSYAEQPGLVGVLGSELAELWVNSSARAGVGVSVATDKLPPTSTCFTTMGTHFPRLDQTGQLEGLLFTVEDLWAIAVTVREYLWTAL